MKHPHSIADRVSVKSGRPSITEGQRREMRKKIAISTQKLFQKEGYRQISMRGIARDVGCSAMTLYKYYDSKVDILHTLWADIFKALFDRLDALELSQKSPREVLVLLASTYVDYWLDNTEHYRLVFMAEGVNQPDVSVFVENPEIIARYNVFLVAISNASQDELSQQQLKEKLDAIMCFLHGISHCRITVSGYSWPSVDYLINSIMHGVVDE